MNQLGKIIAGAAILLGAVAPLRAGVLPTPVAEPRWSVSVFGGFTDHDGRMFDAIRLPADRSLREENLAGVALAYRVGRFWSHFTLEVEGGVGTRFPDSHATEGWAAAFVRFDGFPWKQALYTSVGASVGLDYLSTLPPSEVPTIGEPDRPTSKLLHYFSPEIAFAFPEARRHEMFVRLHHRSGVWGLFNGVHGGSDALVMGYRLRF